MNKHYVDEAAIESLARAAGIEIEPERRAIVAERLNEMHAIAVDIESIDFRRFPPAFFFDPGWALPFDEEDLLWTTSPI